MDCPKCGGPMWDNRQTKKSPKQPDYKCKDRQNCDGVIWPPKGQNGAAGAGKSANGAGNGTRPTGPLAPVYADCLDIASRAVKHYVGDKATAADIIAAAATIFIGATNTGRPVKKVDAPKPPPPPPPPVVQQEEYDEADNLPF
jgi:hypothetical protein